MKPTRRLQRWLSVRFLSMTSSAIVVAGAAALPAAAADIQWVGETSSYTVTSNWAGGVIPVPGDNAFVNNGGTVQVQPGDPTWWVTDLRAAQGAGTTGNYEVNGSRVNLVEWLRIGVEGTGSFTMTDGFLNMVNPLSGRINIGESGTGTLTMQGGVIDQKAGRTTFGERSATQNTSVGTLNMSGGLFNNGGEVWIGQGGTGNEPFGFFNLEGGDFVSTNWLVFGRAGGDALVNISGGTIHKPGNNHIIVADRAGNNDSIATATLNQTGGSIVSAGEIWIGQGARDNAGTPERATGVYNLSAGDITVGSWFVVGRNGGNGTLNMTGGTITKIGGGHAIVGAGTEGGVPAVGVMNHTGGLFDVSQSQLWIGENGLTQGTYNLSGAAELRASQVVVSGRENIQSGDNPVGILNLDGGTMQTGWIIKRATGANAVGRVNFNGTQVIATASRPDFISGLTELNIQDGGFRLDTNGFDVGTAQTFTAAGTGGLVKTGTGTFEIGAEGLFNANGAIEVNAGVLTVNGQTTTPTVAVASGAALAGTGTITGNTTMSGGSSLLVDSLDAQTDQLAFAGNLTASGPVRIDFTDSFATAGTYPVATYSGTLTGGANFQLGRPGTVSTAAGTINVTIQNPRNLTWTGSQNSTWDIFSTQNWTSGAAAAFGQSDSVTFTDSGIGSPISVVGPVRPLGVAFQNTATLTLTGGAGGAISGEVSISKTGTGKVVLALDNPLTSFGIATIDMGELQLGNGGQGGSLGLALVDLAADGVLSFDFGTNSKVLRHETTGAGSLIKRGSGTVTLTGRTVHEGTTTVEAGRLALQGLIGPVLTPFVNNAELEIFHTGGPLQVDSTISGTGKLIKSGDGEVWLNADNSTFTGDIELVRGPLNSLNITHGAALGSTSGKTIVHGRNGNTGQHLNIRTITGGGTVLNEPIEIRPSALGRAGIRHESADQTLTLAGPITMNATGLAQVQFTNLIASSTLNITGDISGTLRGAGFFMRGSTGPINVTGSINVDFGEMILTDDARVTIGAPGKTYTGFRTNVAFGHLRVATDNALDPTQPVNLGQNNTGQAAKLILGSGSTPVQQTVSNITVNNPAPTSGVVGGATANSTLTMNMTRNYTFGLLMGGAGANENNLNLVKTGPGVLTLTANNTYTGTTTASGGRLVVNGSQTASPSNVTAGGTIGGTGTVGPLSASGSGMATANISPADNGVGNFNVFGTATLGTHSALNIQMNNWTGGAGAGSDLLTAANVSITGTSAEPVRIRVSPQNAGTLTNFTNTDRSFTIVQAAGTITGFDASKFVIDASAMTALGATGSWTVSLGGNNTLVLNYSASTPPADPYAEWAQARGLTGADAAPGADPDNDSLRNAIEFVVGGEPNPANANANSAGLLPTVQTTTDHLRFTFRLAPQAASFNPDKIYVQYTTDITSGTWTKAVNGQNGIAITQVDHPTEAGVKLVTVAIPRTLAAPGTRLFARLATEIP